MSPPPIDWQRLREELQPDGALRDLYVHGVDEQHWASFLAALQRSPYRWRLKHGEQWIAPLPTHFSQAAKLRESGPVLLQIELLPTLVLACHFFKADEIELDVVPNDLQNAGAVGVLIDFMEWLAHVVSRPVVLTHENRPEDVILRIENREPDA